MQLNQKRAQGIQSNSLGLDVLNDHYKDTFQHLARYIEKRDSLFFKAFVIIILIFLLFSEPQLMVDIGNSLLNREISYEGQDSISIPFHVLNTGLLILLLYYLMDYFRIVSSISYQMNYMEKLEEIMNEIAKREWITREGKAYKVQSKLVRRSSRFVYKQLFPIILISLMFVKIIQIWINMELFKFDIAICVVIVYFSVIYIVDNTKTY